MSEIMEYTSGSKNVFNIFRTIKHNMLFARDNPDYFYPAGIWAFCGPQGSGKTISAVQTLQKLCKAYPKAIVCSNIEVRGIDREIIPFVDYEQIKTLTNGIYGVIFLIDEIHLLWNSLESRDIPIAEMTSFCQMRKDRRVILGTSQVYARVGKAVREQYQYIIDCSHIGNLIQTNKVLNPQGCQERDGHVEAKVVGNAIWFRTPELYNSYDTLYKIVKPTRKGKSNA